MPSTDNLPGLTGGKMARPLDPDRNPWDQQDGEVEDAYAAFKAYRDSEHRKVTPIRHDEQTDTQYVAETSKRKRWSATWSWSYRSMAWDRYVTQQELDDLIRYRRTMNERHRNISRVALSKVAQWLVNVNADTLKPLEAARILEVATRIEREAAGAHMTDDMAPADALEQSLSSPSLGELLGGVSPDMEAALAELLHSTLGR